MADKSFFRRLRRDDSGQTLILAVLMMPVLIGIVGMAVDTGYAFDYRRGMQQAADSASLAGARAVKADPAISAAALAAVVNLDATQNGFLDGSNSTTISVCRPGVDSTCPTQYTYAPTNWAVKVIVSQPKQTFFSGVLGRTSMTIGVTSVASSNPTGAGTANFIVLDDQCTSAAFHASGGATVAVAGSIWVNSCDQHAAKATGGTNVNAAGGLFIGCASAGTCGGYQEQGGSTISPSPTLGQQQLEDPLASLPVPAPTGPIYNDPNINSGTHTLQPGIYTNGITIKGGNVTFAPGIYFIDGKPLTIKGGATVDGTDVMFYAYNRADLNISGGTTTVTMAAPTTGTYKGIWWFQERSNDKDALVTAGATFDVSGTIYISNPRAEFAFAGNSTSGSGADYTLFVVWRFKITGGGNFQSNFGSLGGLSPLPDPVALSE